MGNSTATAAKHQFRPDIEGLRGVAILLVIAYHAGVPFFSGGYVGVDVFFVLSGYLITGLLLQEVTATGKINLTGFYARRGWRLLPALALVLIVTMAVGYVLYVPFEQTGIADTSIFTAAYVSNLHFARQATQYLQPGSGVNPLLHTWSFLVEEQFYLAWSLLLLLAIKFFAGRDGHDLRRGRLLAFMITLASASGFIHTTHPL